MKQNWIQTLSLLLCLALLLLTIGQNRQMKERHEQLENQIHDLHMMMSDEIHSISSSIEQQMEEADRIVANYALEPAKVSKEKKALLADISVTLKEWHDDTQITLLTQIGEQEITLPTNASGNGVFTGRISLPVDDTYAISIDAIISGNGLTKRESLGGYGNLSMLLPLQNTGSGWDGPNYVNGTLSSNFSIFVEGRNGLPGPIANPRFLVYQNGELVQTIPAVIDPYSGSSDSVAYTVDTQGNRWHLDCEIGDAIDIRFCCEDEYGLGYNFLFSNWVAEGETPENYGSAGFQSGSSEIILYWP